MKNLNTVIIPLLSSIFLAPLTHSILPLCWPNVDITTRCANVTCPPQIYCNGPDQILRTPICGCCPVCIEILRKKYKLIFLMEIENKEIFFLFRKRGLLRKPFPWRRECIYRDNNRASYQNFKSDRWTNFYSCNITIANFL